MFKRADVALPRDLCCGPRAVFFVGMGWLGWVGADYDVYAPSPVNLANGTSLIKFISRTSFCVLPAGPAGCDYNQLSGPALATLQGTAGEGALDLPFARFPSQSL